MENNKEQSAFKGFKKEYVPYTKRGAVINCQRLNVREQPNINANILGVLPSGSIVKIDKRMSTSQFWAVQTEMGVEGYCVKGYIKIVTEG